MPLNPDFLFQALSTFAGRVSSTSDSRVHQNAAKQLQADLKRLKMECDSSGNVAPNTISRPTGK
ncbi:hypothetical protein IAD21_00577 [Abditibacteriota bacterium]|nr:hypothetical protein IAD21_00577 [Abditibacteriota bacterium]